MYSWWVSPTCTYLYLQCLCKWPGILQFHLLHEHAHIRVVLKYLILRLLWTLISPDKHYKVQILSRNEFLRFTSGVKLIEIVCSKDALLCIQMAIDISIEKCNLFSINLLGADCKDVLIHVHVHVNTQKRTTFFFPKSLLIKCMWYL